MEKIINTYEATAADGAAVTVYEVQEMDDAGPLAQPNLKNLAGRKMQLSDGRVLTMVGEREFKIAGTDEVFLLDRPYTP